MLTPAPSKGFDHTTDLVRSEGGSPKEPVAPTPENLARAVVTSGNWIDLSYDYRDKSLLQDVDLGRLERDIAAAIRAGIEEDRRQRAATRGPKTIAAMLASLLAIGACTGDDYAGDIAAAHRSRPPSQAWLDQGVCRTRGDEAAIVSEQPEVSPIVRAAEIRNRVYTACLRDKGLIAPSLGTLVGMGGLN